MYLTEIVIKIKSIKFICIYFNTLFVWNCTGYGYVNFGGVNVFIIKQPPTNLTEIFQTVHIGKMFRKPSIGQLIGMEHRIGITISQK